jgi:hypothetical protein
VFDLLQVVVGVIFSPSDTFRELKLRWLVVWGLVIALLAHVPWVFLQVALMPKESASKLGSNGLLIFIGTNSIGRFLIIVPIYALVIWGTSRLLGGRSKFTDMLQVTSFATVPFFLIIPVLVIGILIGEGGLALLNITRTVMDIWFVVLVVIGVRETDGFTIWRSISAAVLLPILLTSIIGAIALGPQLSEYLPKTPAPNG